MRTLKSSGLLVLAAVTALVGTSLPAIGAVPGQASLSPTTTVAPAATASAGQLQLSTTSSEGIVTWDGQTQRFREGTQCQIVQDVGDPDLLTVEGFVGGTPEMGGISGAAGFRNGDIGVFEPNASSSPNNAAQCFRVDADSFSGDEMLVLSLGTDLEADFGDIVATKIALSLFRSSKNGTIAVELVGPGGTATETFSWTGGKPGSDLNLPPFSGQFTEIRLTADVGSFSLRAATFDLAYTGGILDCLDEPVVLEGDGVNPSVTLRRLNNADPAETCELIPYTLSNADQDVSFLKPLDEQISAQFLIDIVWTITPANTDWETEGPLLPETTIDYEQGGGEITLRWCPDVTRDGAGEATGIANVLSNTAVVDQDDLDGKQFTCIISQNAQVFDGGTDPDYVVMEQQIYLIGDARMSLK